MYFEKKAGKHSQNGELLICAVLTVTCLAVIIHGYRTTGVRADSSSRGYCFQIDSVSLDDGIIKLEGFSFRYDQPEAEATLFLRSENGEEKLETVRMNRPDVERYFLCECANSGFAATGKAEAGKAYEIMIKWPLTFPMSTGVFVSDTGVQDVPEGEFAAPEMDADFVENGVVKVYRPDYHCWVYQYKNALYWIVDWDFFFEEDGTTKIQYQLWTTQKDKLPEKRLANGYFWDNLNGYFEKYEIDGNWNGYRVMKRDLPSAYPITSIVTGYYKNGAWIWKEYFRPQYEF